MNESEVIAAHQIMLDLANDLHLVAETEKIVMDYFAGVEHESLLARRVNDLKIYVHSRDRDSLLGTALSLRALVQDLAIIKSVKPDIHGNFRRRAKSNKNLDDYYGVRMEIKAAADLARSGIPFAKQECPDFVTQGEFQGAGIECTSVHYTKETGGDVMPKIVRAIYGKSVKPYANRSIAAYIDITNVLHNGVYYMSLPTHEKYEQEIELATRASNLGAVVLLMYHVDIDARSISRLYRVFRHPEICLPLNRLLDATFPTMGRISVNLATTPLIP